MSTTESLKDTLTRGKTIEVKMGTDALAPSVNRGDVVTVKSVPFKELKQGDIVLCTVAGRVGLRRIAQARQIYGVHCLEVSDAGSSLHHVQESTVLGRMMHVRRRNGQVEQVGGSPILASLSTVMRGLKRVLFPGT